MATTAPIAAYAAQTQAAGRREAKKKDNRSPSTLPDADGRADEEPGPAEPDGRHRVDFDQIAQFSTVSGIEMQTSMELAGRCAHAGVQGASLVGRDVLAPADSFDAARRHGQGGSSARRPTPLKVEILGPSGAVVREIQLRDARARRASPGTARLTSGTAPDRRFASSRSHRRRRRRRARR